MGDIQGRPSGRVPDASQQAGQLDAGIGLVCISGGGEFETVREWCDAVAEVRDFIPILDCLLLNVRLRCLVEIEQQRPPRFDIRRDKFRRGTILRVPTRDTGIAALYIQVQISCSNHVSGFRGSLRGNRGEEEVLPTAMYTSNLLISFDRIITMYQVVYDAIHAKSGQSGPLKLQYIRTEKEIVTGWASISVRARDLLLTDFLDNTTV